MSRRENFNGRVKIVFQPAEEGRGGAAAMIREGVLEDPRPDVTLALHLWNGFQVGEVRVRKGSAMSASDKFEIKIFGHGGHAAIPHNSIDAIVISAHAINAIQTIVSRNLNPIESAVISICTIRGGNATNVIAQEVVMEGSIRSLSRETRDLAIRRINEILDGITKSMGGSYSFEITESVPVTFNSDEMTEIVVSAAESAVGSDRVFEQTPTMGSEDMSLMMAEIGGCYFFVGAGNSNRGLTAEHHSDHFDFDENALLIAIQTMINAAELYLQ